MYKICILLILAMFGAACSSNSHFKQRDYKYLASNHGNQLVLPACVDDENISDYYVLPCLSGFPGVSPLPPGSELKEVVEQEIIAPKLPDGALRFTERDGEQALMVALSYPQTWVTLPSAFERQKLYLVDSNEDELYYLVSESQVDPEQITDNTPLYKVHLRPVETNTVIMVTNQHDVAVSKAQANKILKSLETGLSGSSKYSAVWTLGGLLSYEHA